MNNRPWLRSLLIGIGLVASVLLAYQRGALDIPELSSLDARFRLRGAVAPRLPIVLITIDQDSFDELDLPWPWPRTLHAELIRKLATSEAKLIAFDILFTEPKADPAEDHALAEAIHTAGNVILAAEFTQVPSAFGPKMSMSLPIPLLREQALGYGQVNLLADGDGVVRSALLGMRFQDHLYPAFAYQIYRAMVDNTTPPRGTMAPLLPGLYFINFRGPPRSYPVVPYYRVLRDEIEQSLFKDKIVVVGASAPSLHDLYPTPYSASQPTSGAEIQANFVETLAAKDPIIPFSGWGYVVIFALLAVLTIWAAMRVRPLRGFALIMALAGMYALAALYLFAQHQVWMPVVPSLLGIVATYGGMTMDNYVREQRERTRLRAIFSKYVSPDVVDEILENREGLGLGGKRRHITVLFSDIRDFTSISEHIAPEQVVSFLSDYLAQATQIVFKHGGTVDKFIGDAIMAIFGAPTSYADDALRAVHAGFELIKLVESLGPQWLAVLNRPLKVGVGINSGAAVVGSIGSELRADFTAIGDTVNLASRLEGLTKELGVPLLMSEFTAAELGDRVPLKSLHRVKVAGRDAPVLIYTLEEFCSAAAAAAVPATAPYVQQRKG
jgi:adenylate cyclase